MFKKKLAYKTMTVLVVPAALLLLYAYGFFNTEENSANVKKPEIRSEQSASSFKPVSIKDSVGNIVTVKRKIERIVVSYYGCAEVLRSLSYAGKIVGVGETITDRPFYFPKLSSLPSTGKTTFNEIEQILALNPDTVILRTRAGDTETRVPRGRAGMVKFLPQAVEIFTQMSRYLFLSLLPRILSARTRISLLRLEDGESMISEAMELTPFLQ
ncbi:MAG: hypothetical protein CSA50_08585 [Gammaproteobacteria bacterium]|nr:MAG: hypothetical protein CSA50_08585 [Gammaproteobacteria bacterium]